MDLQLLYTVLIELPFGRLGLLKGQHSRLKPQKKIANMKYLYSLTSLATLLLPVSAWNVGEEIDTTSGRVKQTIP
jgi:hypothetical protein